MTVNHSGTPRSGAVYGDSADGGGRHRERGGRGGRTEGEVGDTMTGDQPAGPARFLQGLEAVLLLQGLSSVLCQVPDPEVRA